MNNNIRTGSHALLLAVLMVFLPVHSVYPGYKSSDRMVFLNEMIQLGGLDDVRMSALLSARGKLYVDQNKFDLAKKDFVSALKLNPNSARTRTELAIQYLYDAKYDLASGHLNEALRIHPDSTMARGARGVLRYLTRDYDGAFDDFETVIQIGGKNSFWLIWAYAAAQKHDGSGMSQLGGLVKAAGASNTAEFVNFYDVMKNNKSSRKVAKTLIRSFNKSFMPEVDFLLAHYFDSVGKPKKTSQYLKKILQPGLEKRFVYLAAKQTLAR